ncbi:MAG: hypothetical protein WCS03_19065 [Bacteroidota bacterium]
MKRLLFVSIFIFSAIFADAQAKLAVSYSDFQAWAKQIKITGYPFMESEQDGAEYTAMLGSGPTKALQLRVAGIDKFDEYKMMKKEAVPYTWNGYKTVNFNFSDITFLIVALPEAEVAITFGVSGNVAKAAMEEMASKSNLQNLKPVKPGTIAPGVKWPEIVPADMRISNVLSIKTLGTDGTFKDVIEVKATMGPELVATIQAILKKYNGTLSSTETAKLIFICGEAEDLKQLGENFKKGEPVIFIYYVKK